MKRDKDLRPRQIRLWDESIENPFLEENRQRFHVDRNARLLIGLSAALIVLMLGVVHTGAAYCLYFSGMASLPVQSVAILGYLEPVVSVLCSVLFQREPLSVWGWIGAVLILAAAAVSELMIPPDPRTASDTPSGPAASG